MENHKILVVDDEQEMLNNYQRILSKAGYDVQTSPSGPKALKLLKKESDFHLVVCDLKMPEMDGMELVSILKKDFPYLPIIMVTGYGTVEQGVAALKIGVIDFIEKPFTTKRLLSSIEEALEQISPQESSLESGMHRMVARSKVMLELFEVIRKIAYGNANILITGESGVGKELVARSIHKYSLRRNQPMIPINCGALPANLFESELFGYEKGAFTGAFQAKPGLAELANGGTLFLDEICEMPPEMQVKLLRMLEDRKIRRIGGKQEINIDIRLVSATNRKVEDVVQNGMLREDLFYRINTIQIHIPPLRERIDDIQLLAEHFLARYNQKYDRGITGFTSQAIKKMQQYHWPGNVRELQNIIERSYYLAEPPIITPEDLPIHAHNNRNDHLVGRHDWENLSYHEAKELVIEEFERRYLRAQLEKHGWNISRTAASCGIDRRTIHRLINKYKLR